MMQKKNRYKNRVRFMTVFRILFLGCFLGSYGVLFVKIRNSHVTRGNEIMETEVRIAELSREIEMWENRIAGVNDRLELERRLRWVSSDLEDIDPFKVIRIDRNDDVSRPIVGVF